MQTRKSVDLNALEIHRTWENIFVSVDTTHEHRISVWQFHISFRRWNVIQLVSCYLSSTPIINVSERRTHHCIRTCKYRNFCLTNEWMALFLSKIYFCHQWDYVLFMRTGERVPKKIEEFTRRRRTGEKKKCSLCTQTQNKEHTSHGSQISMLKLRHNIVRHSS